VNTAAATAASTGTANDSEDEEEVVVQPTAACKQRTARSHTAPAYVVASSDRLQQLLKDAKAALRLGDNPLACMLEALSENGAAEITSRKHARAKDKSGKCYYKVRLSSIVQALTVLSILIVTYNVDMCCTRVEPACSALLELLSRLNSSSMTSHDIMLSAIS
jgi:hypothetical protein